MLVQVIVVVVAVVVVLLTGVDDIPEADLVHIPDLVILGSAIGTYIVHILEVQCLLDDVMSVTGTILIPLVA